MLKVYEYAKCSTCVKALKFLDAKKVKYEKLPIVDKAPSQKELKEMLAALKERGGSLRNLFNTSGVMYKEMKLSEKLSDMTEAEAIKLLSENGKLVKRPFVISNDTHLVGFKEDEWKKVF
ncbi:ArsC family transcriptional regulator [Bdellovibrio bacteriovorus]|uniref:ArsC family transcriptional regulator n=1 Tax=Bdellovibrio bacteriovorus TaxID=959 RepID=A0A162GYV2_BDEBC|nr:arsenate reductase family protein [Bdellovibrio bacteriovorus]KYG69261.1 ArsC family transcriptional regulator [Bdellovibrio bacteriovorus]